MRNACNVLSALAESDSRLKGAFRKLKRGQAVFERGGDGELRAEALADLGRYLKFEPADGEVEEAALQRLRYQVYDVQLERTGLVRTWEEMFKELQAYKEKNGDCNVPAEFAADRQFGWWVNTQKAEYKKGGHGNLAGDRLEELVQLGAIDDWEAKARGGEVKWQEMYTKLQAYQQKNGDCNVPKSYPDPRFRSWLSNQKRQCKEPGHGNLADHWVEKFLELGAIADWDELAGADQAAWQDKFEKLERYNETFGDCNVPSKDHELGIWVCHQKAQYKRKDHGRLATGNRLEMLLALGAIDDWEKRAGANEARWQETFGRLEAYQQKNGDCNVPKKYEADRPLGAWVNNMKVQYRKEDHGTLAGTRMEKLKKLGAIADWDKLAGAGDAAWQAMYEKLEAYKKEKDDCNVPSTCKADPRLGQWVNSQRQEYMKPSHGSLARGGRLEKLKALGADADWEALVAAQPSRTKQTWEEMYEKLKTYQAEKGDCKVPNEYVQDPPLGSWVYKQWAEYKKKDHGSLATEGRLELLRELGAIDDWLERAGAGDAAWQEKFERLQAYKAENGHCNVPVRYDADKALGKWVATQKEQYKKPRHGQLAIGDRLEKLRALGAIAEWEAGSKANTNEAKWQEKFERLQAYQVKNGHCNVPTRYDADKALASWVATQKKEYKKPGHGNLAGERLKKLRALGADWANAMSQSDSD